MKLIKTDLRGLNALQMLCRARMVRNQMKNNPLFPAPTPSMAEFEAAIDALQLAIIATHEGGSKLAFIQKQQNLDKVATMIKSLATYVCFIAQGDPSIILAGSFELRRPSTRISSLDQPTRPRAKSGTMPQTIDVTWRNVRGARMYKLHITKGYAVIEGEVRFVLSSKTRCCVEGLDPLEYYTIRVQALGAHAESPLSGITTALSVGLKTA